MMRKSWRHAALAACLTGVVHAASALACDVPLVKHTLRDDIRAADMVVLATPRSDSVQAKEYLTLDVQKVFKGTPVAVVEVQSQCNPAMCQRACFRAGEPVVLFLERSAEDAFKLRPRYQLRVPEWGVNPVLDDGKYVAELVTQWSAVPAPRAALRYGTEVVGTAISMADFERIAAQEAYADREPPLIAKLAQK